MITDFNEEELERLQVKLDMLMKCKRIESLGYKYEPYNYIYLDHTVQDGYEPVDQIDFITSVLTPVIDYGTCIYTSDMDEEVLKGLNIEIPYSDYDTDIITGMTIKFVNTYVDEYIDKNLDEKILKKIAKEHMDGCFGYGDCSIDITQVALDKQEKALYIIIPDEYIAMDEFIESMIRFLDAFHAELDKTNEEVA